MKKGLIVLCFLFLSALNVFAAAATSSAPTSTASAEALIQQMSAEEFQGYLESCQKPAFKQNSNNAAVCQVLSKSCGECTCSSPQHEGKGEYGPGQQCYCC